MRSMTEQEAVVKAVEERQSSSSPSSSSATLMCPSIGGMPINEFTTESYFTPLVLLISHVKEDRIKSPSSINTSQPCISDQCLPVCRIIHYYTLHYGLIASEASFLVCSMRGFSIYIFIYIYIYIFQAVRRAVNEMFETPDTVFNNLELLVNPSSTAKKCSATEDCCRNPGGDRHPSSTVKYCSATGLLPNRQRGERPGVNGLPFSHRRKETPVFNKLQLLVNRRLRQNRRKRDKPVFNS